MHVERAMLARAAAVGHVIHDLDLDALVGTLDHRAHLAGRDVMQSGRARGAEGHREAVDSVGEEPGRLAADQGLGVGLVV